ncbi:MAG TPA: hypothetical protein VF552_06890 [Allosphingosinicella sp.]|jgi:UPF0716 family protein affecting phage T7 exclusion
MRLFLATILILVALAALAYMVFVGSPTRDLGTGTAVLLALGYAWLGRLYVAHYGPRAPADADSNED